MPPCVNQLHCERQVYMHGKLGVWYGSTVPKQIAIENKVNLDDSMYDIRYFILVNTQVW